MSPPFHRLFFALWPNDALRQSIDETATRLERELAPGGRRLNAARYHLTLQFLGDFDPFPDAMVASARAAAAQVRLPPFELTLDRAGGFRGSNVWWLGTGVTPEGLLHLWQALAIALQQHGVPIKPAAGFSPHLTIQRNVRSHIEPAPIGALAWPIHDFVLVDSQSGQPYRIIGRWPLQA